jgi:hypothetical protein
VTGRILTPVFGSDYNKSRFRRNKGWRGPWHRCPKCASKIRGERKYSDHLDACYKAKA